MKFIDFADAAIGSIIFIKRPYTDEIIEFSEDCIDVFNEYDIKFIEITESGDYLVTLDSVTRDVKLMELRGILGLNNGINDKMDIWVYDPDIKKEVMFNIGCLEKRGDRAVHKIEIEYDSSSNSYLSVTLKEGK